MRDDSEPRYYLSYHERCGTCPSFRNRAKAIETVELAGYHDVLVRESDPTEGEIVAEGHDAVDEFLAEEESRLDIDASAAGPGGLPSVKPSEVDLSAYEPLNDRIDNGDFESGSEPTKGEITLPDWEVRHGSSHYVGLGSGEIDGQTLRTRWRADDLDATSPAVEQTVDLTDVTLVALDAAGSNGNPHRSEIVLEVDGETQGTFISAPRRSTVYRDLGVELNESYDGEHTVGIKWVQIAGDNVGNSIIDNVRTYR